MHPLSPLATLQQAINTSSTHTALALSSLHRPPPAATTPPPGDDLEWLISLGLAQDGQKDRWWQAQLDLAAVERVFTVERCAILPLEMPDKVKRSWDGGELSIEGLEKALAGEGDGKVQLVIQVAEDVRLSVDLPPVDEPIGIPYLKLMTRWANPYTTATAQREEVVVARKKVKESTNKVNMLTTEVNYWKAKAADAKKEASSRGGGGASGRMGSQEPNGSGGGRDKKSPRKAQTTNRSAGRVMPKQALHRTNDNESGGFLPVSDSDSD
ncbi:hypothetical protein BCR35DRAFT_302171 [Leucosporidium creatinivorum]|uniref:XRCC4-like factor-domain-containing protein n=1 Tax=Leucosporidium creatinivorum TaxID=106004 RepID=A0A1Y2FV23_9BASI|nr:hypothetical protein BCR35DRAFT_302171 [Leucosporidium creatinivorum]